MIFTRECKEGEFGVYDKDLLKLKKAVDQAIGKGATQVKFYDSKDPSWPVKKLEFIRIRSDKEIKEMRIKELKQELKDLENEL